MSSTCKSVETKTWRIDQIFLSFNPHDSFDEHRIAAEASQSVDTGIVKGLVAVDRS